MLVQSVRPTCSSKSDGQKNVLELKHVEDVHRATATLVQRLVHLWHHTMAFYKPARRETSLTLGLCQQLRYHAKKLLAIHSLLLGPQGLSAYMWFSHVTEVKMQLSLVCACHPCAVAMTSMWNGLSRTENVSHPWILKFQLLNPHISVHLSTLLLTAHFSMQIFHISSR